jgi:hypothetical protein
MPRNLSRWRLRKRSFRWLGGSPFGAWNVLLEIVWCRLLYSSCFERKQHSFCGNHW